MRNEYEILMETPQTKTIFVRPTGRWEDSIKTYLKEIIYERVHRIQLLRRNPSEHRNEPSYSARNEEFLDLMIDCQLLK
jgi:hypothetical protein